MKAKRIFCIFSQLIAGLFVVVASYDLVNAIGAQACTTEDPSSSVTDGCYPWGGEGPTEGRWHYQSKVNYLITSFLSITLCMVAIVLLQRAATRSWKQSVLALLPAVLGILLTQII